MDGTIRLVISSVRFNGINGKISKWILVVWWFIFVEEWIPFAIFNRESLSVKLFVSTHVSIIWESRYAKHTNLSRRSMALFSHFRPFFDFYLFTFLLCWLHLSKTTLASKVWTCKSCFAFGLTNILWLHCDRVGWLISKPCMFAVVENINFILIQTYLIVRWISISPLAGPWSSWSWLAFKWIRDLNEKN